MLKGISSLIRKADFYSFDVHLYFEKDSKKARNLLSGFLSIISCMLIGAAVIYFFINLVTRKNMALISSERFGRHNLTNFSDLPFMIRLGGHATEPLANDTGVYRPFVEEWLMDEGKETQYMILWTMKRCSLEMVQEKYRSLFAGFTDLDTFFCIDWQGQTRHLFGVNGETRKANNHYDFDIRRCFNETDEGCLPYTEMMDILENNVFLDFRQIDFEVNNDSEEPQLPYVKQDRMHVSYMYTKIFWNLKKIEYFSDFGFIFESVHEFDFFQFGTMTQGIEPLKDVELTRSLAFIEFTVQLDPKKSVYSRTYEKAQNVMANVGGIIKFIMLCGQILSYVVSERFYYKELVSVIHDLDFHSQDYGYSYIPKGGMKSNSTQNNIIPSYSNNTATLNNNNNIPVMTKKFNNFLTTIKPNNNLNNNQNSSNIKLESNDNSKINDLNQLRCKIPSSKNPLGNNNSLKILKDLRESKGTNLPLSFSLKHYICPLWGNDFTTNKYAELKKEVNEVLNVKNVMIKLIEVAELKSYLMQDHGIQSENFIEKKRLDQSIDEGSNNNKR